MPGAVILTWLAGFISEPGSGGFLTLIGATTGATLIFLLAGQVFGERAFDSSAHRHVALPRDCDAMQRPTC